MEIKIDNLTKAILKVTKTDEEFNEAFSILSHNRAAPKSTRWKAFISGDIILSQAMKDSHLAYLRHQWTDYDSIFGYGAGCGKYHSGWGMDIEEDCDECNFKTHARNNMDLAIPTGGSILSIEKNNSAIRFPVGEFSLEGF